jgi:hypothetical protein
MWEERGGKGPGGGGREVGRFEGGRDIRKYQKDIRDIGEAIGRHFVGHLEAFEGIWSQMELFGGIGEAFGMHLKAIWRILEPFGRIWRRLEAVGRHLEGIWRHLEPFGAIWEAFERHVGGKGGKGSGRRGKGGWKVRRGKGH